MKYRRACIVVFVLAAVCAVLFSCRPRGVLSAREMEDILVDLHKCDGVMYAAGYDISSSVTEQKYYAVLLEKRGITQAQFDSSLMWYTNHPQRFDKIYPRVKERLKAELGQLQEEDAGTLVAKEPLRESRKLRPLGDVMDEHLHGFKPVILRQTKEK